MNRYVLGAVPVVNVDFYDAQGKPADPTNVTLTVISPAGVSTSYAMGELSHDGLGEFSKAIPAPAVGTWVYTFAGTGNVVATKTGSFRIAASEIAQASAPCSPWAGLSDVCGPCAEADLDESELDGWLTVASAMLYGLTGSRWPGECVDTIYPAGAECLAWLGMARRAGMPGRPARRALKLPGYPVTEIAQVVIDGVVIAPERYRVNDQQYLVYLPDPTPGARQHWPISNPESLANGAAGTWSVTYWYGTEPPPGGRQAAAALGCQLALACHPEAGTCRLPERVTSITRQGITMAVIDPLTLFKDGLTGLAEVDLWVQSTRLANSRRPATLVVPGRAAATRRGPVGPTPLPIIPDDDEEITVSPTPPLNPEVGDIWVDTSGTG